MRIRSIIESPVLDQHKWAKVSSIPADAVLVDMEDAVPVGRKEDGRRRVLEILREPSPISDRVIIARPNHLNTPWGYDDVVGLAEARVACVLLPMIRSAGEVREVQRLLRDHGADPHLLVCVETPQAVASIEEIVAVEGVAGIIFGEGDLTAEMHISILGEEGALNPALLPLRMRTYVAAAAAGIPAFDAAFVANIRDLNAYRARVAELARLGASGIVSIYPDHVPIVNEEFSPSPLDVEKAQQVVSAFDASRAAGAPAVQLPNGKVLLVHDYLKAQHVLSRARQRNDRPEAAGG